MNNKQGTNIDGQILREIKAASGRDVVCRVCTGRDVLVGKEPLRLGTWEEGNALRQSMPLAAVICRSCGHVDLYSLLILGFGDIL